MTIDHATLKTQSLAQVRQAIRSAQYQRHTAGLAFGRLQCNLVILPKADAQVFEEFCRANAKACPLVAVGQPGSPRLPSLGADIDLRTDIPRYNVYRQGKLDRSVPQIDDLWQDDWVGFAIGCSFTFERALREAGIAMRHIDEDKTVPMFVTNRPTQAVGAFEGPMVVSMRPIAQERVEQAITISNRYPLGHGGPVHVGDPSDLGIKDLAQPDWGDVVALGEGEVPVFWACGVTPQVAIRAAKPDICITHAPGSMLITDLDEFHDVQAQAHLDGAAADDANTPSTLRSA